MKMHRQKQCYTGEGCVWGSTWIMLFFGFCKSYMLSYGRRAFCLYSVLARSFHWEGSNKDSTRYGSDCLAFCHKLQQCTAKRPRACSAVISAAGFTSKPPSYHFAVCVTKRGSAVTYCEAANTCTSQVGGSGSEKVQFRKAALVFVWHSECSTAPSGFICAWWYRCRALYENKSVHVG